MRALKGEKEDEVARGVLGRRGTWIGVGQNCGRKQYHQAEGTGERAHAEKGHH